MRKILLFVAALAVAAIVAPSARASVAVYEFSGVCGDCEGMSRALLTVKNYTPGTALSIANFVRFEYQSNLLSMSTERRVTNISGSLSAEGGPTNLVIEFFGTVGHCDTGCAFTTTDQPAGGYSWSIAADDFGTSGVFTGNLLASPEPGSIALLASGIGGLALLRRKRKA